MNIGGNDRGGSSVTKRCLTLVTPWTVACQAPLSMGFSRQEHWSGLPFPSPDGKRTDFLKIEATGLTNGLDVGSGRRVEVKIWEFMIYTLYSDEIVCIHIHANVL